MSNNRFTKLNKNKEDNLSSRFYSLEKESPNFSNINNNTSKTKSRIITLLIFLVSLTFFSASIIYIYQNNAYLQKIFQKYLPTQDSIQLKNSIEERSFLIPDIQSIKNAQLREAMYLYERGYLQTAKSLLADILENNINPQVRSHVNFYLGIIAEHQNLSTLAMTYYKRAIEEANNNYYAHYNLAYLYHASGKLEQAYKHIQEANNLYPQDEDINIFKSILEKKMHRPELSKITLEKSISYDNSIKSKYSLGLLYKEEGTILEAKSIFLGIINQNSNDEFVAKSAAQIASIFVEQGSLEDALFYLKKAVTRSPQHSTYLYNLALIEYKLGKYKDALANLKKATLLGNKTIEIYIYMAELYESLQHSFKAEVILKEAQQIYPNNTRILSYLGTLQIKYNKWDAALQTYKQLFFSSSNTSIKQVSAYYLGLIYSEFNNYGEAKKYLELSIDLEPFHQESIIALGSLYTKYNQPDKTIELYRNSLKEFPDAKQVIKALTKHYINLAFWGEAEVLLRDLLVHPNKNLEDISFAHYSLGDLFYQRDQYSVAIEHYKEALKSHTPYEKYTLLISLARALLKNNNSPQIALSYLHQAQSMQLNDDLTNLWVSKALYAQNTYESKQQAEKELTAIIHNSHDSNIIISAHLLRGNIYYENQSYIKALHDFNTVLEHDPSNEDAFQNRRTTLNQLER